MATRRKVNPNKSFLGAGRRKSNKNLEFKKDPLKSYVYIEEKGKSIGMLMWHYAKKEWIFEKEPRGENEIKKLRSEMS